MRFLFFDLGNVIVNFDIERLLRQVAVVVGRDTKLLQTFIFDEPLQFRHERGDLDEDEYFRLFCDWIGREVPRDRLRQALCDIFTINTPIFPVLKAVTAKGIPRGILSNTSPGHWAHCQTTFPLISETIPSNHVLSFKVGAMKPDFRIYQSAYETARRAVPGIAREEVGFIDDLRSNVNAAIDFGFDAILYSDSAPFYAALAERGLTVSSFG